MVDEQVVHVFEAFFGLLAGHIKVAMGFAQQGLAHAVEQLFVVLAQKRQQLRSITWRTALERRLFWSASA